MSDNEILSVHFVSAFDFISSDSLIKLSDDIKLKLYAYYKTATIGPCNTPKPSLFDFVGRAKWDAWKSTGNMSQKEAMLRYIEVVENANVGWRRAGENDSEDSDYVDDENDENDQINQDSRGFAVSTLSHVEDGEEEKVLEPNIFSFAKEGKISDIIKLLDSTVVDINAKDKQGLTALHWASDSGQLKVVELLIERGAGINALTNEQETPLHYACLSEQLEVARYLYRHGANTTLQDDEGKTSFENCEQSFRELVIKDEEK
ncbi:3482_t:CDS:2 [Ambispora gerdemannii]|uniref:3482_t:CDS:1 n=1 Tax=Ambispora gerdemannii TaxID=144530 RepID=A0A9N8VIB5_9GLOM|nr:3482_t:CDS:2 [Ambispora gerdemannii]